MSHKRRSMLDKLKDRIERATTGEHGGRQQEGHGEASRGHGEQSRGHGDESHGRREEHGDSRRGGHH